MEKAVVQRGVVAKMLSYFSHSIRLGILGKPIQSR